MSLSAKFLTALAAFSAMTGVATAGVLPPIAVPEPMTMALFGAGAVGLYIVKKWRR